MEYFVIGDEDTVLGLGMAGVRGRTVNNMEQAERLCERVVMIKDAAFSEAIKDRTVGIIIITEAVADLIRSLVDKYIFTQSFPLIVEIPDRTGRLAGKPGIRELVNRTIGLKL